VRGFPAAILLLCAGVSLHAGADEQRARVNYMLNCQGCHLPDGDGTADRIPRLKNFVGYFLHSEDGRAFLINVSGVASSPLSDSELAELVNWTLLNFSKPQLPVPFQPYTAEEVAELRKNPELDPESRRKRILEELQKTAPQLAIPPVAE